MRIAPSGAVINMDAIYEFFKGKIFNFAIHFRSIWIRILTRYFVIPIKRDFQLVARNNCYMQFCYKYWNYHNIRKLT